MSYYQNFELIIVKPKFIKNKQLIALMTFKIDIIFQVWKLCYIYVVMLFAPFLHKLSSFSSWFCRLVLLFPLRQISPHTSFINVCTKPRSLFTSLIVCLMLQMYFITVTANKVTFLYNNKEVLHIVSFMKDLFNNTITTSMPSTRYNIH